MCSPRIPHDLRRGNEKEAIVSITGHSLKTASQILDRYLVRTTKLAEGAMIKRLNAEEKD